MSDGDEPQVDEVADRMVWVFPEIFGGGDAARFDPVLAESPGGDGRPNP